MKKSLKAVAAVIAAIALTTACSSGTAEETTEETTESTESTESTGDGTTYKIGVLQFTQHAALDKTNEGFIAALDDAGINYEIDQQNASNDQSTCQTIAEKLVNDGNDLIYAIATPAAQAVAGLTKDIPVVISAVTDPAESGLVADNNAPGGNVTGVSDLTPIKEQIDLLKQLIPDAQTIGVLYCSAESNSAIQAEMTREACEALGMEAVDYTVSNTNEIQTVVESMVGKVDAIYAPTDNTIANGMATVGMIASDNGLPVFAGDSGMVEAGGIATYAVDYYQLGYMAGEMAVDILVNGTDPAEMPIGYLPTEKYELTINEDMAAKVGVDVSSLQQ
ncbi:MAG TPA: ABC transporter substrate-binding protein [Firmicutes bacterium]|nr:ABC transporter substrate-binding protein [Bacillota bacterium]